MADHPPIPDDHPIREVWRAGALQNSLAGLIELAESGDVEAARQLLLTFVYKNLVDGCSSPPLPELNRYLADCLNRILDGENPTVALRLGTGKRGRPPPGFDTKFSRAMLGWRVANRMNESNVSLEEACAQIADECHVSADTAKKAYVTYMVI